MHSPREQGSSLATRIVSVQVGLPRTLSVDDAMSSNRETWSTGFYKEPVSGQVWLGKLNLDGDGQADLAHHGGPNKAVCAYPAQHYRYWRNQLHLADMPFGAFGENFTLDGITEEDICIGDVWKVGDVLVQISQPRQPCWKLARRWGIKNLAYLVQQTGRTGWYFRVLQEGFVSVDQPLTLVERPHPEWSVAAANRIMHFDKNNLESALRLATVSALSESWQATLTRRCQHDLHPDERARLERKDS